ncbi:MAG: SpaA isopeptide-forming pilin-related protein [Christensenellales bacterium]
MFVLVTENTRVFSDVDETADEADGELYDGSFVRTANVQVEEVRQDGMGRTWLLVRYLYGEEEPDGEMAWTDTATVWVMAEETQPSDAADYDVTAYAFPFTPVELYAANNPPRLQTLSGNTGEFYAGQTVYAYSVHDDVQIASLKNYGAIYATQHYINEHVVYCLEHTMNSPGIKDNPEGPYKVVDLAQYGQTAGYSGIIYSEKTMHAIGWVLRHTFPYMGLDRYEDECLEWSRAAGQFAIREVIKQLEGSQYVRDYWRMDDFYRATGQAPKEYLEYARWLAANALTYAQMTGEITVSNVSVSVANGVCTGTATLTTDAPRIRIRRSVGTITGYTGGENGTYVYLNSGDTITVSQAGSGFSFAAESVSTEELEANFLVAVPDANVQKVVIPQRGSPYPLKSMEIRFDMPNGALVVTKTDAASGAVLAGATFELTNASGTVVATQITDADGTAHFDNLPAGNYTVREINAPTGYLVAVPDSQSVTVTAGETTGAAFTDERIRGRIRIAKTDSLTKEPLAGAEFTITRTDGTGTPIVLTTDVNGNAETDWLDYGRYRVTESKVPAHYETSGFSTEIDCTENGKTYLIEVENEPTKGFIQIVKTDALDGRPIEGVQFDIVDAGGNVVGTMTTDADGATTSPALFKGQYTVREHENPTGYVAELAQQDAAVNPDETTYLGASNQPIQGRIRIVKRDQLTKELLAGAEFTVTRLSGLPSHQGAGDGEVVAVITTDADGVAETGWLTWGTYRVTESKVPEHFVDAGFSADIVIDEENFKTCELEVENEPTKGFIRLTKTDRANGNLIAGVKFDIYENDEYGNALVGSMTTGADGVAISEPLRKGRYIVREHGATKGYVFEEIALDATVKPDETTDLAATNQPVRVKIKIYKRDKDEYAGDNPNSKNRKTLPRQASIDPPKSRGDGELTGAVFQVLAGAAIKDRQGNVLFKKGDTVVDVLTTAGEDASAATGELWPGLYEIVELTPPKGYHPSEKHIFVDTVSAAGQSEEAVVEYEGLKTNTIRLGAQAIVKILGDDHDDPAPDRVEQPEAGAEFNVYLKSAGSYEKARLFERDHLVTNKRGYAKTKALPYGIYVLEQTKGKEGYEIKGAIEFEIDGTEDIQNPPPLTLSDRPILYRLRILKMDRETGKTVTLAHTSFKLKDANGETVRQTVHYPTEKEIDTFTTDETGGVTLPETLRWGLYYIEEISAPEGYAPDDAPREIELAYADDQTPLVQIRVEVGNTYLPAAITLHKEAEVIRTTEANGEVLRTLHSEPGEGFVFGLFSERDIHENGVTLLADTLVAVGMTDENGRLTFDGTFPHGDYYVRELQAKTGWKLNPNRFPITLEPGSDAVIRVELAQPIYDELVYTPVTLTKTDITGAKTVPGAQIEVRNEQGEMIYRATTDANGEIPDIPVTPGTYAFREILAPSGYALNEAETRFTVDEQGNVTGNTMLRDDYTRVQLRKQDENGVPLSGVEFALVTETGTRLMTAVSDANGLVTFEKIPYGRYTVEETQPLPGYFKTAVHVHLTVDGTFVNPNEPLETVTNTPMRLAYKKVDTSGRPLAGVEFSLINAATNVVTEVATSDENGEFIFRHIDYGDWIIRETAAPNGYRRMEDMLLHIGEDFVQPEPITLVNVPSSYMFMKMDGDGNPLSGVKFVLEDADGNVLREMESGEDGTVLLENLDDGRYVIRETEALQGYAKTEDTLTFTIDESYVVPEEMPCLVNEKEDEKHDIQTGVDIELTPMMTEGAALLLLAGIILIGRRLADRKRRKK